MKHQGRSGNTGVVEEEPETYEHGVCKALHCSIL